VKGQTVDVSDNGEQMKNNFELMDVEIKNSLERFNSF